MGFTNNLNAPAIANVLDADLDQWRDNSYFLLAIAAQGSIVLPGWKTTVQGSDKGRPDSITLTRNNVAGNTNPPQRIIIYYTWSGNTVSTIQFCYDNGVGETSPSITCYPAISFYFDESGNPLGTVDPQDVLTSLVSYWTFNEAGTESPLVHTDSHGSYNIAQTATSGAAGKLSNCIEIAGVQRVNTAAGGQSVWKMDNDFTVAGWAYNEGLSSSDTMVSNYYNLNGSGWYFQTFKNAATSPNQYDVRFGVGITTGFENVDSSTGPVSLDTWHHYAAVYTHATKTITIYVDAVQVAQAAFVGTYETYADEELTFGQLGYSAGSSNFDGFLDEWGFWSEALSSTKVSYLHNSGTGRSYADF